MASFLIACIGIIVLYVNATKLDLTDDQRLSGIAATYAILRVSFAWQLVVFALFSIFCLRFTIHSKAWKYDWPETSSRWRKLAWMVNGAGGLLTVFHLSVFEPSND